MEQKNISADDYILFAAIAEQETLVTDRQASCFQPKIRRTFSENGELSK